MSDQSDKLSEIVSRSEATEDFGLLDNTEIKSRAEEIELEGRIKFFALRDRWSNWIIAWISVFILFHVGITVSVGLGILDFTKAQWLIPSIVLENFLQVAGMGVIVIKFLYPDQRFSKPPAANNAR